MASKKTFRQRLLEEPQSPVIRIDPTRRLSGHPQSWRNVGSLVLSRRPRLRTLSQGVVVRRRRYRSYLLLLQTSRRKIAGEKVMENSVQTQPHNFDLRPHWSLGFITAAAQYARFVSRSMLAALLFMAVYALFCRILSGAPLKAEWILSGSVALNIALVAAVLLPKVAAWLNLHQSRRGKRSTNA